MTWRSTLALMFFGLVVAGLVAAFQPAPGYMDADYYYAGGMQLVNGHGFSEPYLWNYLDDPAGIPHPSHGYWMPLASILAASGAWIFGHASWLAARTGSLLVAALIPPITAALAWSFTSRRDLAFTSGLLAVFPAYYVIYLPLTDTFGLYMLFGGLFFLVLFRKSSAINPLILGLLAGMMHLSRADGVLWLLIAFLADLFIFQKPSKGKFLFVLSFLTLTLAGYLLVMTPWFIRNIHAFGSILAPGASKALWLTSYDQLFSYPASLISFNSWLNSGMAAIVKVRLWALGINLERTLAEQGEIFLLPLVGIGLWHMRKDQSVRLAALAWFLTLSLMTFVFPFAGARGGFFHSGAALQPVWWALAPLGLDRVITWGKQRRGWNMAQAGMVFRSALVVFAVFLTASIFYGRVAGGGTEATWGYENEKYSRIDSNLVGLGMSPTSVVMVVNPPGFFLSSGNPAIPIPNGDVNTILFAAHRYGAKYLILEQDGIPAGLVQVYLHPNDQAGLIHLGTAEGAQLYEIQP